MNYKRLEIYTWWKCNHKCIFCIEYPNMEKAWKNDVTKEEVFKKLIKYKKKGYNHVTFLWWEPFIHWVFWYATKLARKLWYTVLVTTNWSTLQFDTQAKKHLPNVDQLLISVPIIDKNKQLEINRTKWIINFDKVFENINKYWDWNFLKINTVVNKLNLDWISDIIKYISIYWVKEISITYPDIIMPYYSKEHIINLVAPKYSEIWKYIDNWFNIANEKWIKLILTDIPFCCLPNLKYIKFTDDYLYQTRLKVSHDEEEIDREEFLPRRRKQISKCRKCAYIKTCWWPSRHYNHLYWLDEIKSIDKTIDNIDNKNYLDNQSRYLIN